MLLARARDTQKLRRDRCRRKHKFKIEIMLLVVARAPTIRSKECIYKSDYIYFRPTSRFGHDFIFERGGCEKHRRERPAGQAEPDSKAVHTLRDILRSIFFSFFFFFCFEKAVRF